MRRTALLVVSLGIVAALCGSGTAKAQYQATVYNYDQLKNVLANVPAGGTGAITLGGTINVNDELFLIDGAGKVITFTTTQGQQYLTGSNTNPLLLSNGDVQVIFDNLTAGPTDTFLFTNGNRIAAGGSGNTAAVNGGGALSLWGSAAIPDDEDPVPETRPLNSFLTNTEFRGNRATEGTFTIDEDTYTTGGYGGAVFAHRGTVELLGRNTLFHDNSAEHAGGAIAAGEGAIFQFGGTGPDGNTTSVIFGRANMDSLGNHARRGGAIYADRDAAFTFNGITQFIGNYTELPPDLSTLAVWENGAGGAISALGTSTFTFAGQTSFVENTALFGGAVDADGGSLTFSDYVLFDKNSATGTTSGDGGGAIRVVNGGSVTIGHSALFTGNTSQGLGGAAYVAGGTGNGPTSTLTLRTAGGSIVFGNARDEHFDLAKQNLAGGVANAVYVGAGGILDLQAVGGRDIRFYDPIAGVGAGVGMAGAVVNKTGSGAAWFYGNNVFEGDTNVNEGFFIIAGEIQKKDGGIFIPGATYGADGIGTFTVSDTPFGHGTVRLTNGSRLSGNAMILRGGGVYVAAEVDENHQPVVGSHSVSTADINFTNGIVLQESTGNTTAARGGTFEIHGGVEFNLDQILSGSGQLMKTGDGILTLRQSGNIYTGLTRVLRGALQAFNDGAIKNDDVLKSSAGLELLDTAAFYLNDTNQEVQTLSGEAGTLVHMERIPLDPTQAVPNAVVNTLTINPGNTTDNLGVFNGTIIGNGSLRKLGTGTITLAGANTYTGGTFLGRGKIVLQHTEALGTYYGSSTDATTGLVFIQESASGANAAVKTIEIAGNPDRTLRNRFAILTPDSQNTGVSNTLNLNANGKTLTISGNRTTSDITYTLPATTTTAVLGAGGGAFHIGNRAHLVFDASDPASRYVISDNTTTGNGGAIAAQSSFALNPDSASVLIENNSAFGTGTTGGNGGGIFLGAEGALTMGTGTTFSSNQAAGVGGAVYLTGGKNANDLARSLVFSSDPDRPVVFRGNIAGAFDAATKRFNSFYLERFNELTFQTDADSTIRVEDPMESSAGNADNTVVKTGLGTLVFAGTSRDAYGYYGNTILREGRTELESYAGNIARYGQINTVAPNTFHVDTGATLAGWGEVRADQITVGGTLDVQTSMLFEANGVAFDGATLDGSGELNARIGERGTESIQLKNTVFGDVERGETLIVNAALVGEANFTHRGLGTLVINRDSRLLPANAGQATGQLRVDAGTVAVGTTQRPTVLSTDSVRVNPYGTFKVESQSLVQTRSLTAGTNATLSIGLRNPPVDLSGGGNTDAYKDNAVVYVSQIATIGGATLDITGFAGGVDVTDVDQYLYTILYAEQGIVGDFSKVTIAGRTVGTTDFVTLVTEKTGDSRAYVARVGYAWYAGNDTANGTFDIATDFTLGIDLKDVVPSGSLWDGQSLIKRGEGTLTLTGDNSYTGGTRIIGGTLAGDDRSLQGSIDIANGSTLRFLDATNGTFDGTLTGSGNVVVDGNGEGILRLNGTHTLSGKVAINGGGSLSLDGNMRQSMFTVEENGAFYGNATVMDLLVKKGGLFSPGAPEAVGSTTVRGKLTFKEDGIYQIHVAPDGSGDKTSVIGTAEVSGGTLLVSAAAGTTSDDYTQDQYTLDILAADGGIKGMFKQTLADLTLSDYLADVYYTDSVARLVLVNKYFTFTRDAHSENAAEVGALFDRINADSRYYQAYGSLLSFIRGLAPGERNAALREIAGSVKADAHMIGQWDIGRPTLERLDLKNLDRRQPRGTLHNIWIDTFYQGTEALGDRNANSYGISRSGFILGLDRRWTSTTVVGLTFGYSRPILQSRGDRAEGHDFQAGLYIGQVLPLGSELKGYFGFGGQGYATQRWLHNPAVVARSTRLDGDYQGDSFDMSIELSRPFRVWRYGSIRPFTALDILANTQGGHTETGDELLAGEYARTHYGRAWVRLGAKAKYENDYASLWFRMAFALRFAGESAPETKYRPVATPDERNVVVRGVAPGDAYLQLGLGGHFDLNKRKTRQLFYGYDLSAAERLTEYTGSLGFVQFF